MNLAPWKFCTTLTATLFLLHAAAGLCQTYPNKPVRIILPAAAGSGPDAETRKFAAQLALELGQPVIVENRPGGGGMIGMDAIAKAAPDGYTLGTGQIGNLGANPKLFDGTAPFDIERDIAPISLLGKHRWMLIVNSAFPARNLAEFIALAKTKPGEITIASSSLGGLQQITGGWFEMLTGTKFTIIPYGATFWQSDLLAGTVNSTFYPPIAMVAHIKAGKLRALAISGNDRSPLLPEVPTFAEAGVTRFSDTHAWFGLIAPAGVPQPILEKISAAGIRAAHSAPFRDYMESVGATAIGSTPAEFAAFLKAERAKWKNVIVEARIKVE